MPTRLRTIDAHAAGAALRLVVDGFPTVKGPSMRDKQRWIERQADHLRTALLTEPRGHADLSGAVLTEPVTDGAAAGLIFMHASGYSAMCGHGLVAAVTIAVERGLIGGLSAETRLSIDTVAGLVVVEYDLVKDAGAPGRVARVRYRAEPARVVAAGLPARAGAAHARVDVVSACGLYALVDAESAGVPLTLQAVPELRRAAQVLFGVVGPAVTRSLGPDARLEGVVFTAPCDTGRADLRIVTVYDDLSVDRSPSGGGTTAALVVLSAMGLVDEGRVLTAEGLAGLAFAARVVRPVEVAAEPDSARVVEIEGSAYVTGEHAFVLGDDDPLRHGLGAEAAAATRLR